MPLKPQNSAPNVWLLERGQLSSMTYKKLILVYWVEKSPLKIFKLSVSKFCFGLFKTSSKNPNM